MVENVDSFDGNKILTEYSKMSKDEAIDLLGEKYAKILKDRIKEGNITFDEFTKICNDAFENSPKRANWIRNIIFNKLSNLEGFKMFEQDENKRQMYSKIEDFKEKARNGKLTEDELQQSCDMTFGKDSEEAKKIYNNIIQSGKVKVSNDVTNSYIDNLKKQNCTEEELRHTDIEALENTNIENVIKQSHVEKEKYRRVL